MGSDSMPLQLANATLDFQTNTARKRNRGCYLTKMATISVPDCAMGGGRTEEPEEAMRNRDWAYSHQWSISPHPPTGRGVCAISRAMSGRRAIPTLLISYRCWLVFSRVGPRNEQYIFLAERGQFEEGNRDRPY